MTGLLKTQNGVVAIAQADNLEIADFTAVDFGVADYIDPNKPRFFSICPEDIIKLKVETSGGSIGVFTFYPGWSNPISIKKIFTDAGNDVATVQIGY